MKKFATFLSGYFSLLFATVLAVCFASLAWAQDATVPVVQNGDFLQMLFNSIGGFNGASALSIAFIVSKLLMNFVATPWADNALFKNNGALKITIISLLNLVIGIVALMVPPTSLTFSAAIVHSSVLAMASVFFNQVYKQYFLKTK